MSVEPAIRPRQARPTRAPLPPRPPRRYSRAHIAMAVLFAAGTLAFVDHFVAGFRMSGWAWLLILAVSAPVVFVEPLDPRAVRLLVPYLAFVAYSVVTITWAPDFQEAVFTLAQLFVFVVAYLLAWRVRHLGPMLETLRIVAFGAIGVAVVLTILTVGGRQPIGPVEMSVRPAAIGLIVLFVVLGINTASWRFVTVIGAVMFALMIVTGSRMAGAALIVVLLTNPALTANRPRWVLAVSLMTLAVLGLTSTTAFKERFFFSQDATLRDVVTLSERLNTAGRRELWPRLVDECSEQAVTGTGIGTATILSERYTNNVLDNPHNEYLRIYCDQGWIGTILFWGFFAVAGWRNLMALRRGHDRHLHTAALQLIGVLFVLSVTDNPLLYTALFMAPVGAVLGLADSTRLRAPTSAGARLLR